MYTGAIVKSEPIFETNNFCEISPRLVNMLTLTQIAVLHRSSKGTMNAI